MIVLAVALTVMTALFFAAVAYGRLARGSSDLYSALLGQEQARVNDLHSRLAARTHGEYAAFANPPEPPEVQEYRFDPTGLMAVEADDGDG